MHAVWLTKKVIELACSATPRPGRAGLHPRAQPGEQGPPPGWRWPPVASSVRARTTTPGGVHGGSPAGTRLRRRAPYAAHLRSSWDASSLRLGSHLKLIAREPLRDTITTCDKRYGCSNTGRLRSVSSPCRQYARPRADYPVLLPGSPESRARRRRLARKLAVSWLYRSRAGQERGAGHAGGDYGRGVRYGFRAGIVPVRGSQRQGATRPTSRSTPRQAHSKWNLDRPPVPAGTQASSGERPLRHWDAQVTRPALSRCPRGKPRSGRGACQVIHERASSAHGHDSPA
jgi:hypothetical protein